MILYIYIPSGSNELCFRVVRPLYRELAYKNILIARIPHCDRANLDDNLYANIHISLLQKQVAFVFFFIVYLRIHCFQIYTFVVISISYMFFNSTILCYNPMEYDLCSMNIHWCTHSIFEK